MRALKKSGNKHSFYVIKCYSFILYNKSAGATKKDVTKTTDSLSKKNEAV